MRVSILADQHAALEGLMAKNLAAAEGMPVGPERMALDEQNVSLGHEASAIEDQMRGVPACSVAGVIAKLVIAIAGAERSELIDRNWEMVCSALNDLRMLAA